MWKKIVLGLLLVVVLAVGAVLGTLYFRRPDMAPPLDIKVDMSPERIARGQYIFNVVSACSDCHSEVDETRYGFPTLPGGLGKGKVAPDPGLPGKLTIPNLTPDPETGSGKWTDGELIRAIREGIGHDGRVLFPMMPYSEFGYMSDQDVQSVVAYIRTLPPIRNPLPPTKIDFPVNLFIKSAPRPVGTVREPDHTNPLAYGRYLTKVSGCQFCHTPVDGNNQPIAGKEFSGGQEFALVEGVVVRTFNLTPDPETGTGKWTEQQFLDKFYQYKDYAQNGPPKVPITDNTVMPWLRYANYEPDDLKAIWAYLKTVPPIVNAVETMPSSSQNGKPKAP